MEKLEIKDKLNFICDKYYSKVVNKDERLLWSGDSLKINKSKRRQKRFFVITDKRLINLGKRGNFLTNIFSKSVKRSMPIEEIKAITYSTLSNNFVVHLPSEYDYYFCTPDKDEIIEYLLHVQENMGCEKLKMFMVEDIDLFNYMKTDTEKVDKWPKGPPQEMDLKSFKSFVEKKKK